MFLFKIKKLKRKKRTQPYKDLAPNPSKPSYPFKKSLLSFVKTKITKSSLPIFSQTLPKTQKNTLAEKKISPIFSHSKLFPKSKIQNPPFSNTLPKLLKQKNLKENPLQNPFPKPKEKEKSPVCVCSLCSLCVLSPFFL